MRQIYKLSEKVAEFGVDQQRIISETLLPANLKICRRFLMIIRFIITANLTPNNEELSLIFLKVFKKRIFIINKLGGSVKEIFS